MTTSISPAPASARLDHLDAVRAFALLLGVVFHASLSFLPTYIGWAVTDLSTGAIMPAFLLVSHSFRMELFFLIAGFFSHLTFHRRGLRSFLESRFVRLAVPFILGWFLLRPLVVSGWTLGGMSMRGDVELWTGFAQAFATLKTLPQGLFTGSHLWFLYYLAMLTVLVLVARALLMRTGPIGRGLARGSDRLLAWMAASNLRGFLFVVPTAIALWFMRSWGMDTPDQSLLPHWPALLVYGGFFSLGWMLHRTPEILSRLCRLSWSRTLLAVVSIGATIWLERVSTDPSHPQALLYRAGFVVTYAFTMWSLVLLSIGVFERLVRRQSAVVRYLADSSYWMYLIHLPIVLWLQIAVAELPGHWSLKLTAISLATIGLCLLSYDLFVRSTIIGKILNGRRRERVLFTSPALPRRETVRV